MDSDQIKEILSREDAEFRAMLEQHHQFEAKLDILAHKNNLSLEEELEEKTIKKRKLLLKDLMADRIRSYARAS